MKKIFLLIIMCISFCIICVNADAKESVIASYNPETSEVTVSGYADTEIVVAVFAPRGTDFANLADSNLPVCFEAIHVDGGKYEKTIGMPDNAEPGEYLVYISDSDETPCEDTFVHVTGGALSVLSQIKEKPEDFIQIVSDNASTLGIGANDSFYNENKTEILNLLDTIKGEYSNAAELYNDIYMAYALTYINGKDCETASKILKKYETQLSFDYDSYIDGDERLSAGIKNEFFSLLSSADFAKELKDKEFMVFLNEQKALAAVRQATDGLVLRAVLEDGFNDIFSDMISNDVNYIKISSQSSNNEYKVFAYMADCTFATFESISENFAIAAKEIYTQLNPPKLQSGGGGGASVKVEIQKDVPSTESSDVPKEEHVPETSPFFDVKETSWEYKAVATLTSLGIISGYGDNTFRPTQNITRAEFTKLVLTTFEDSLNTASNKGTEFSDVEKEKWYAIIISKASAAGLVNGHEGLFRPDEYIKREDAALIIYNMFKNTNVFLSGVPSYSDNMDISIYAYTAVGVLQKYKIMTGFEKKFRPFDLITRSEAAQLVYNAIYYESEEV